MDVIEEAENPQEVESEVSQEIIYIDNHGEEETEEEGHEDVLQNDEIVDIVTLDDTDSRGIRRGVDETEDSDPGSLCMICYSEYDTGVHKLCCLKCGHLFGRSCIEHWLKVGCTYANRKCPTCNTKAAIKDIRIIYAKTLIASDTTELVNLNNKIEALINSKSSLELQLKQNTMISNTKIDMLEDQIKKQERTIKKLKSRIGLAGNVFPKKSINGFNASLLKTVGLSKTGGGRVLAHSDIHSLLVASQMSTNPSIFPGYGIRKLNTEDMTPSTYIKLHDNAIRDMCFGIHENSILLTVSLDDTAKLFDLRSNVTVQTFKVNEHLWSGCWSPNDTYDIFCGSMNGAFYVFDRRHSKGEPKCSIKVPNQFTGYISMCSIPPKAGRFLPNGGILGCSLTKVIAFYKSGGSYEHKVMSNDGSFLSLKYNPMIDNILLSAKSSSNWKTPRHMVCELPSQDSDSLNVVQTYYAAKNPGVLTRSSFIPVGNDQLICGYGDRDKSLDVWSMTSEMKMDTNDVHFQGPILDLCSIGDGYIEAEQGITVSCLAEKDISLVKFKFDIEDEDDE